MTASALPADRIPVIAGIGEITDRPADVHDALEPLALMAEAARRAEADANGLLGLVDSIDIVGLVSWRYDDLPARLAERLSISPARCVYGPVGGESPVRYLHEAARRIARGESRAGLVVGAEAQHAVNRAKREGVDLPWTPYATRAPKLMRAAEFVHPLAAQLGVAMPVTVYPFYEAATAHAWGQSPREAQAESARLWSAYSRVAADNPFAWLRRALSAEDIATPSPDNRLIAWPYTKRMVANPNVNQGAAVLVTSLAAARAAGVDEDRLAFIGAGASANEPRDYLARDTYAHSPAQDAVLNAMTRATEAQAESGGFDALELYSCFPVVPKMARRTLGLPESVSPTVTGGLSFFGAPLNNYMTHAACAMVRALRNGAKTGLLYGQGEFVTKHHALIASRDPQGDAVLADFGAQALADAARGEVPPTDATPEGSGFIESFTVIHDRDGAVVQGVVIVRMNNGARTLARIPAEYADDIAQLTSADVFPIGARGRVQMEVGGVPEWRGDPL
ncbi:MAG: acetyl-CoA acetyltransferase [Hyphomonadaceae bacterium]